MKLGPLQTLWVETLEAHPERQITDTLASGTSDNYKACCLGQALICLLNFENKAVVFKNGSLEDTQVVDGHFGASKGELLFSYEKLGLFTPIGRLKPAYLFQNVYYESLATMNDSGVISWLDIARYIRNNSDSVFSKSV